MKSLRLGGMLLFCLPLSFCLCVGVGITASVAQDAAEASLSIPALRLQAVTAIASGKREAAKGFADKMVQTAPDDPAVALVAADIYLRTGNIPQSVQWFDRYLESEPARLPDLWQRGIALYFAGQFDQAAKQFEEHRKVNPHDVENAAWHFLCIAKAHGQERAKQMILPAPNDPRVPMQQVLEMLGSGNTEAVKQRVAEIRPDSDARRTAEFYGDLYLGLYYDAVGEMEQARQFIERSAKDAPHHYMGDVARVYATYLANQPK